MRDLTIQDIQKQIVNLPNRPPAMHASDVAMIYEVETRLINRAVQRNPDRFPEDFCFRLTQDEYDNLRSQIGISSSSHGGARYLPWMFTRFGANQLSTVLKSPIAAQRSVQIMRAFSTMEEGLSGYRQTGSDSRPDISWQELTGLLRDRIALMEAQKPRKNRKPRPFTDEDRAEIRRLNAQGMSQSDIAKKIDRNPSLICTTLNSCKEVYS